MRIKGLLGGSALLRTAPWHFSLALIIGAATACDGLIGGGAGPERTPPGAAGAGGSTNTGGGSGSGTGGSGGSGGAGALGLLPARIRRLTNAEYDASVKALLGIDSTFGKGFTPDVRQDGFTRNDAQRVDPVFIMQVDDAAQQLATEARAKFNQLAPCADPVASGESCARTFLGTFAARAYRRPATPREIDALLTVYRAGAMGALYADGIDAVIHAVLVSPAFLYTTEVGPAGQATKAPATLTPHETAAALSYLITGAPPDETLFAAATSGEIMTSAARQSQARRLFVLPSASIQVARIVEEWLGIDRITETAKDSNVYPAFAGLKDAMKRESDAFITEVMWKTPGDVSELLSANWTIAEQNLAQMYGGVSSNGRVLLTGTPRLGILNQGAFLAVHAHANETAPVLRGVAVLRRIACIDMPSPTSLNINVVPPVPDPSKTTRQRFDIHKTDTVCAGCHGKIDAFGFAFENFDGEGRHRTKDNGQNVDSRTEVVVGLDFDGRYDDSAGLVAKMATSPAVRACFARHVFRAAAARSDSAGREAEKAFVDVWNTLPAAKQGNIGEVLVAWVGSDSFVQRRSEP